MTGSPSPHRVIRKVLVGAMGALWLVAPGWVASTLLGYAGATTLARSVAQFLTTMAILFVLARYQRQSRARRRLMRG